MFSSIAKEFEVPVNWIYRGEGNCNVVVSLPKERKILRIRKIKKARSILSWLLKWITDILYWYCGSGLDDESRDLSFYKNVMTPLIGSNFICDAEQVFLSRKQIKILEKKLAHQRPDYRKMKSLQYGRAALFHDYAYLPQRFDSFLSIKNTFAVELKPKQGWVPFSEKLFPKCTFCMNQYIKHEKGQTKSVTSYCPFDLFSGEHVKMIKALKALIYNPQNNFKVFKNGQFCYGEDCDIVSFQNFLSDFFENKILDFENLLLEFCLLINKSLLTDFETTEVDCNVKLFCEWNKIIQENSVQMKLPKGSVLERILSAQMLDVEGNQYYYKLLHNKNFADYDYVKKLLREVAGEHKTCLKCRIMMLGNSDNDLVFVPYLISALAKDCSLMLTFKNVTELVRNDFGSKHIISTKYGHFIVNVGVFDLYPKPISTILKHRRKIKKLNEITTRNELVCKKV